MAATKEKRYLLTGSTKFDGHVFTESVTAEANTPLQLQRAMDRMWKDHELVIVKDRKRNVSTMYRKHGTGRR